MIKKIESGRMRTLVMILVVVMMVLGIEAAAAHNHSGYSHESSIGYTNRNWMGGLPGGLRLSMLSIPGTHDTMAYKFSDLSPCAADTDSGRTQTMDLVTQLESGVRVLDIRIHHSGDSFYLYHGQCYLDMWFGRDVMDVVNTFLDDNPQETVIMKMKVDKPLLPEQTKPNSRTKEETFASYLESRGHKEKAWGWGEDDDGLFVWLNPDQNPTLEKTRGKIVVIDNMSGGDIGLKWDDFDVQDEYEVNIVQMLYPKWVHVRTQLRDAAGGDNNVIYANFLSGVGPTVWPWFVASGHSNQGTKAARRSTGLLDPPCFKSEGCLPDFPRTSCLLGICTVSYEGTNILTTNYLADIIAQGEKERVGIILADFPGAGLISNVIAMNPINVPPVANAGGPYYADEGTAVFFDASGSSDPDGDVLYYAWDVDGDGELDTVFSMYPDDAQRTWYDDWIGSAMVEVYDGISSSTASASVTVYNVAPTVTASGGTIDENGVATVSGTITDPGTLDSFTAIIDWGEGLPVTYNYAVGTTSFSESHQYLDDNPTVTPFDDYTVKATISDDDGGTGSDSTTVRVNNVNPVTSIDAITDEAGEAVGTGVREVLTHTQIDLEASFTDAGSQDAHTAEIDWNDGTVVDLGSSSGSIATAHTYTEPGIYTVLLDVTDDDGGVGPAAAPISVVDAAEALAVLIGRLQDLANEPGLDPAVKEAVIEALAKLDGDDGGLDENGAIDQLRKGNLNAALVKMWQAVQFLEAAEAAGAALDLTSIKSLLALAAKSAAVTAIVEADAVASKRNELRMVEDAYNLIGAADALLAGQNYVDAVNVYREAAQEIQGIVHM